MLNLVTLTLSTDALRILCGTRSGKLRAAYDLYRTEGHVPRSLAQWLQDTADGVLPRVAQPVPVMQGEGRAELTGRIQALKQRQTEWAVVLKALVLLDTGCKCWVSVPEHAADDAKVGQLVAFRGTVKHPRGGFDVRDPFVVAMRPSNWRVNPVEHVLASLAADLDGFHAADFDAVMRNEGDVFFGSWEFGEVVVERVDVHRWHLTVTNDDRGDDDNPHEFVRRRIVVSCDTANRALK